MPTYRVELETDNSTEISEETGTLQYARELVQHGYQFVNRKRACIYRKSKPGAEWTRLECHNLLFPEWV